MSVITPVISYSDSTPSNSAVSFASLHQFNGFSTPYSGANEFQAEGVITENAIVGRLKIILTTAPGSGKSWTFTIRKNGADTNLNVTISGTDTEAENFSTEIQFIKGDTICLEITPTSTPANPGEVFSYVLIAAPNYVIFGTTGFDAASALDGGTTARFPDLWGGSDGEANAISHGMVIPIDGKITNLHVYLETAPGSGKTRTWHMYKNGVIVNSIPTVPYGFTFENLETEKTDLLTKIDVSAGDVITFRTAGVLGTASTHGSWGCSFIADNPKLGAPLMGANRTLNTAGTSKFAILGRTSGNVSGQLSPGLRFGNLYFISSAPPGAGNSWTITFRQNQTDSALSATISGASDQAASDTTTTVDSNCDEELDYEITATGAGLPSAFGGWGVAALWVSSLCDGAQFPSINTGGFLHFMPT